MTATLPIPSAALDDRLAFTGTSGSGKTYAAGTAVEILLADKKRVGIVDPLGVWWGLRLREDGTTQSRFDVVIFGGAHGDLTINDRAGALIGETVATMSESWIVDLSQLGTKAAERRFMLPFLEALYRKTTGEPLHVVFDEADMFAPQRLMDKEGEAAKLLGMMETFVRRGRVKGFIPWLITQRPAVLSKDVLSQADGLVAMKLTSHQDREALGGWIEGQADRSDWRDIKAALPQLETGEGYVWLPGHGVLDRSRFPAKTTFDSSRTPKRGEKRVARELKPLDVGKVRERLEQVTAEAEANDPAKLKAKIRELEARVKKLDHAVGAPAPDPAALEQARRQGYAEGEKAGATAAAALTLTRVRLAIDTVLVPDVVAKSVHELEAFQAARPALKSRRPPTPAGEAVRPDPLAAAKEARSMEAAVRGELPSVAPTAAPNRFTGPAMKILDALALWRAIGHPSPTRAMVAFAAGYGNVRSKGFSNPLGGLSSAGVVTYPGDGRIALAIDWPAPERSVVVENMLALLGGPRRKIIYALAASGEAMTREALAEATGYGNLRSKGFVNPLGSLHGMGFVNYPSQGHVQLEAWVFDIL